SLPAQETKCGSAALHSQIYLRKRQALESVFDARCRPVQVTVRLWSCQDNPVLSAACNNRNSASQECRQMPLERDCRVTARRATHIARPVCILAFNQYVQAATDKTLVISSSES